MHGTRRLQAPAIFHVCLCNVQGPEVCQMTSTFCRFLMIGLFPWSLVTILTKVMPDLVNIHQTFAFLTFLLAKHTLHRLDHHMHKFMHQVLNTLNKQAEFCCIVMDAYGLQAQLWCCVYQQ